MERSYSNVVSYDAEPDHVHFNYDAGNNDSAINTKRSASASVPVVTTNNLILKSLPKQLFETMRPSLRSVFVKRDQYLYMQEDRLDYVYFPETAVVSELRTLDDGRMVEVAITGREGAAGLSSLVCSSRVANCTQISQSGSIVRIESSILKKLMRIYPDLNNMLAPHLDQYIRQISQRAICNMYHSVKERLCTWLLMVQDRSGRKMLKLTHEQIARTLGVYRPSVTCIALDLKKEGLIDYSRGGIAINDRDGLESNACHCYMELSAER